MDENFENFVLTKVEEDKIINNYYKNNFLCICNGCRDLRLSKLKSRGVRIFESSNSEYRIVAIQIRSILE